jgi:hypothetical protein
MVFIILTTENKGKRAGHMSQLIEMEIITQYESHKPLLKSTRKWGEGINN